MIDELTGEELKILEPFKKLPKTRQALEFARDVNRINEKIRISNELDGYTRKPLGSRDE